MRTIDISSIWTAEACAELAEVMTTALFLKGHIARFYLVFVSNVRASRA